MLSEFECISFSFPEVTRPYKDEILLEADTIIKYRGYIDRTNVQIEKIKKNDILKLDPSFDYNSVVSLSNESKEKLSSIKPETLGQAIRISGVTPADVSVLSIFISKQERVSRET